MLSPVELSIAVLAVFAGWFVFSSLKIRERANAIAREYCRSADVQFLDGSVGFGTLGVVRERGRLKLRRVYVFDYTEHSVNRRHAAIVFVGEEFRNLLLIDS